MTPKQRLQVRQTEARARLADITALEGDDYTAEVQTEEAGLITELRSLDQRLLAAELADGAEPQKIAETDGHDGGDPDRLELRSRCSVSSYVLSAVRGRAVTGAEAELADELNLDAGQIPIELWEPTAEVRAKELEVRAVAGPPGTVGLNMELAPRVFAPSVIPRLGVEMPRVPSGTYGSVTIESEAAADAEGKGDAIAGTAATFAVTTATPKRISARLELAIEDIAAVGLSNYESALRENLSLSLSAELDNQGLNGNGQAPNLTGLLQRLADPTAPTAVANFDTFVATFADSGIDGLWATMMNQVAIVCGVETYQLSAKTFRDAAGQDLGSISFADYAMQHTGGWWTSKRMPAPASNDQAAILYRKGRSMMGAEGGIRTAVCPVWSEIGIDDIYSGSAKGERYVTFHILCGDIILVQADAYSQVAFQVA